MSAIHTYVGTCSLETVQVSHFSTLCMPTSIRRNVWFYKSRFLGAFAKLRKATISFVVSVLPHGTNRLPLETFSWNSIFQDFSKICPENSSVVKIGEYRICYMKTDVHFLSYLAHFFLEWEMGQTNIVEKIKPHIWCSVTFFRKSYRWCDNVE